MTGDGTPMGPGFFIFFWGEVLRVDKQPEPIGAKDDKEEIELIKILFSFLENGVIK